MCFSPIFHSSVTTFMSQMKSWVDSFWKRCHHIHSIHIFYFVTYRAFASNPNVFDVCVYISFCLVSSSKAKHTKYLVINIHYFFLLFSLVHISFARRLSYFSRDYECFPPLSIHFFLLLNLTVIAHIVTLKLRNRTEKRSRKNAKCHKIWWLKAQVIQDYNNVNKSL